MRTVDELGITEREPIIDLGGRDINGTVHGLFTHRPTVVDINPGRGVDIVADAADWNPDREYAVALCTEVFEHTPRWRDIIATAHKALVPGGVFLMTCATANRPAHGAASDRPMLGEFYANVDELELAAELTGWTDFEAGTHDGMFGNDDLYAWAVR